MEVQRIKKLLIIILFFSLLLISYINENEDEHLSKLNEYFGQGYDITRQNGYENNDIIRAYRIVNKSNNSSEFVQIVNSNAYIDDIKIMVIIDEESKKISNIHILQHSETEDYGGYVTEDWFTDRFKNKPINQSLKTVKIISKNPREITAITGATVTSEAVVKGVNLCIQNYGGR
ncbi:FMN-binding protein [Clostridiaceae bacterium M8S5]|nr:FMN-binding protein [Clostridiaceae bacterium M8S5]